MPYMACATLTEGSGAPSANKCSSPSYPKGLETILEEW